MTDNIAHRLYPNDAPQPPAAPQSEAFTLTPAQVIPPAPEPTESLPQETEQDRMEDRLYSAESIYGDVVTEQDFDGVDGVDGRAEAEAWQGVFNGIGASVREARDLTALARSTPPPNDTQRAQWRREAMAELRTKYGNDAGSRLQLAQKLIAKTPGLAAALERTGLGDHPEVIRRAIALAVRQSNKGRL